MSPRLDSGRDYFRRKHVASGVHARASLHVRRQMYEHFVRLAGGVRDRRVLDLGTTPDRERVDSNCFVRWLIADGARVTLCSPEDLGGLSEEFPEATMGPTVEPGRPLPHATGAFDCVLSSAVLEHVGSADDQTRFVGECQRVASSVFLTTPNRSHWLEFHTKLPLLHWLPKATHRRLLVRLGLGEWADEAMLNLLSRSELGEVLARTEAPAAWQLHAVRFLGMESNLLAYWSRP